MKSLGGPGLLLLGEAWLLPAVPAAVTATSPDSPGTSTPAQDRPCQELLLRWSTPKWTGTSLRREVGGNTEPRRAGLDLSTHLAQHPPLHLLSSQPLAAPLGEQRSALSPTMENHKSTGAAHRQASTMVSCVLHLQTRPHSPSGQGWSPRGQCSHCLNLIEIVPSPLDPGSVLRSQADHTPREASGSELLAWKAQGSVGWAPSVAPSCWASFAIVD